MTQMTGTVSRVTAKDWQGTNLYSFQLQNDGRWFRTGRVQPQFTDGATISFNFTASPDGRSNNVDINSVMPATAGEATAPPVAQVAASAPSAPTMSRNDYFNEKDRYDKEVRQPAIEWQAARNAAIALVSVMAQHEGLPGITKSANAAKRAEVFEATVDHYTQKFAEELPHKEGTPDA